MIGGHKRWGKWWSRAFADLPHYWNNLHGVWGLRWLLLLLVVVYNHNQLKALPARIIISNQPCDRWPDSIEHSLDIPEYVYKNDAEYHLQCQEQVVLIQVRGDAQRRINLGVHERETLRCGHLRWSSSSAFYAFIYSDTHRKKVEEKVWMSKGHAAFLHELNWSGDLQRLWRLCASGKCSIACSCCVVPSRQKTPESWGATSSEQNDRHSNRLSCNSRRSCQTLSSTHRQRWRPAIKFNIRSVAKACWQEAGRDSCHSNVHAKGSLTLIALYISLAS